MASVYGSKVKEPKLTRRSELPFEKQSPYAAGLAEAWASFGEAKSVLQRLEQTSGSPPVKDRTQHRPKPYHHVHFDPARATGAERTAHYGHTKTYSSTLSSGDGVAKKSKGGGGKENNEYLVEPKPLNEVESQQSMEQCVAHGAHMSKMGPDSSMVYNPGRTLSNSQAGLAGSSSGEGRSLPPSTSAVFSQQRYDSTVRFSVPSTTSVITFSSPSSTLHPSPPSHPHTVTTTSTTSTYPLSAATAASPSNPNSIGSPHSRLIGGSSASPYSNATAVFGPPVKFGDSSGRHVPVSTIRHPTMVRPAEAPKFYSHSRSHATSASNSVHPRTSTQVAGVGATRSSVPIRTFELPTETLGTLRAKIELQKQAMRATSARANNLLSSRNPTTSSATGFYPLPDDSTTATSSFASSSTSVGGARPRVPHPPTTARPPDAGERAAKRRKIASAPPPRTYTGFSTTTSGRAGTKSDSNGGPTTVSWKSNLESVGAVGGAGGVALPSSLGTGAGSSSGGGGFRFSSQPTISDTLEPPTKHRHLHTHTTASKTVRKVHKIPATSEAAPPPSLSKPKSAWSASASSKPPSGASGLITTSSWRAGKELRERILKGEEDKEVDRGRGRMDYRSTSSGSRKREDTSPAHYSSVSESQSNLSSSQENISAVSSSIDVHVQPERNLSESPHQAKSKDEVGRSHGARGGLDVAEMLKDLEGSESPVPPPSPLGGGGGRERERARLGQARSTTSASGGPTSKKPRYNYEPSYPSERVRHYDQAEVQSYMLKKQEDRRRRELEEKQAREKMVREKEEKLKQLYESQRKRVEANLRVKQKQRLAYSKALATGDIHIHLHTGSTTSSTSTLGSVADSAAPPVPTLAVHPPTPVSKSPTTIGSLTLHVHTDADAASSDLPKSAATTSMLSPRYQSSPLRPSPPSHSPTPPHTSPPRYSRLAGVSPLSSREASRSPSASPRTYSVPSSASTSPKAHRSPTVSSQQHAQLHYSPPTGPTEHAQYGPGQPFLVRDAGHTSAAISAPQSREERIRALTESALRLKERIAMESKRVEEGTFGVGPFHTVQQHSLHARPLFSNDQGYTPSVDLPGVRNVHEHALQAEKLRQEAEAATKIQAAYRGHRVRKSLRWKLPSGQTLGASLREGHTHRVDESRSTSSTDTLTPPLAKEDVRETKISTPVISPLRGHTQKQEGTRGHMHVHTQPPSGPQITSSSATAVPRLSPWQQTGGDEHSIINVFTRQHERLRQTLDQLSDQKRAEIRRFGEEGAQSETPKHSGSSLPANSQQPGATSITHSHSYTYTFEQTSPSRSGSERSPHSSVFSEDSLHASPPPKHKPSSNKTSPSPSSSPRSHLSSPRSALSPPSRTNSASTLTGGSSSSSKSEPKSKQEERVVHAITPPGSPSFVDSFASLSPRSVSSQTSEPKSLPKSSSPPKPQLGATVKPPTGSIPPAGIQVSSTAAVPSVTVTESGGGRLSPRSLELKLHSELNLLETVEDSMRQLSQVESARAVSLAQQETVALAQLLKSRQQGHEQELQAVASKSEKEVEETRGKLDREAALMAEQRQRIEREHAEEMQRIREEASRVSHEATLRLNEARTAASDAVIQAAKEHLEAAHKIAESAASAAAREAVKATLVVSGTQQQHGPPLPPHYHHKETATTSGSATPNYESDFEADSLAGSETGKISETQSKLKSPATRSQASGSSNTTIEEDIEQEGSDMEEEGEGERESATPVLGSHEPDEEAMEVRAGDETLVGGGGSELEESYQSQSPTEEMEEDISEASFQLLPSESHRRQHQRQQQTKLSLGLGQQHRGRGRRGRSEDSEGSSYSRGSSPSQGEGSRVPSPMPSELSPSPGAGEDSFFQFMSRMVRAYMHEEELRARHQATLLRLREDALQEKTKAHLEWLKIKKKALQRKGDDDKMPPLARVEKGLLKKYKQEQAEIHRLKEAQKAARRERRVMLQQQKEISQMRRSAQYYRNKIHQHSRRVSHSPSPSPSLLLDEIKTTSGRLLDESELSMGDVSVAEELSESESQRNRKSLTEPLEEDLEQSLPREYTEDFASYTASLEPVLTATIRTETGSGQLEEETGEEGDRTLTAEDVQSQHQQTPVRPSKPKIKVSPPDDKKPALGGGRKVTRTPKSPSSESHTVKELERMAAIDPHEYLSQREQRLMKRRRAAEEVLKQQQELLKKEQILDKEEEKVNKIVTEALACYQQRTKIKKGRSKDKERSRHSSDEEIATSAKPRSPSTSPRLTKSPLEGERELGVNTKSSISEEIGASGSITAEVSEQILSQMSSSQPSSASAAALQTVHTLTSRGPSDYAMDTFESFQSSVPPPPHSLPLVTSTPSSSIQGSLKKEPLLSDISITESVTSTTSDGSGLEERIKLLKLQLQQKKEEMKRFQTEQKRKKKEILRQQEEQLKRKLEIVENRAKQMKSAAAAPSIPLHSPGTATPTSSGSATPSQAYSEKSDNEKSRESTASPQPLPTPVADLSHPPHPSLSVEREAPVIMKDEEKSASPASVQEQLSPAAQSNSYTLFSDNITTGVHVTPTATSGDQMDGLVHVHDDTVIKIDADERRVGEMLSPTSIPEEHDTSHSTLIEEEEEEGGEIGEGEGEDRQQERPTVEVEEREKEVLGHEVEPIAEELSVKSGSISEHISDLSSEGEQLLDVEQVTVTQLSSSVKPQAEEGSPPPLGGEQYSESFEEPSSSTPASSPSSQAPPIGELTPPPEPHEDAAVSVSQVPPIDESTTPPIEPQAPPLNELTPPIEPQDEVAMATPVDEKPEDTTDIAEHEQVDSPNLIDTKEFEEEIGYQIGQRVLVGNVMAGTVRYIGHTHFAEGLWVGVEIDLPRGRNDGSIDDQRYFSCKPNYGLFAPPQKITIMEESPEYYDEEGEGEGERQQPPFEDDASSIAEEIEEEEEEQLPSEHELEEGNLEDRTQPETLDENVALEPPATIAHEGTPPPVDDDMYSPDFESSPEESEEGGAEADDEEERENEAKPEDGEGFEQVQVSDEPTAIEERRQEIEEYQWPRSEEGTRENSPMVELNHHAGKEETPPPVISQLLQKHQAEENREKLSIRTQPPSGTDREVETITEGKKVGEKTSQITEHPPPASESLETLGKKSESFPQAPEVANQRSQSATPTPAPPPEFAEGALKEMPLEPPREIQTSGGETATSTLKQASEVISEELAQELTNEAYETMHNIWKVKREAQLATKGQATEYEPTDVVKMPLDKEAKLSLEDKADRVTDQLLALLLQSETNVACSIHNFKKSQEEEERVPLRIHISEKTEEEAPSPTSPRTLLPRSPISREPERPVLSPVPEEPQDDEEGQSEAKVKQKGEEQEQEVTTPPVSPLRRGAPAKLILTGTATSSIIESSPPPLSPPSPYRNFVPSFIPAADEFSPPGSPPKHLSQASAARVAAGEKTPFLSSQDKERKGLERSTSTESITSLLDSLTIKTAQCMVPSERANVDQVVERSWQICEEIGFENLHHRSPRCPSDILDMFSDLHELSPEENHCRRAYLELVFNLTVETLQNLHNVNNTSPIWMQESAVRSLLVPEHKNSGGITLEKVQKRVYKALMRGQLPSQLPAVKFLRGMKRPGGREIDFVDTILIKELREEEPGWIDYCSDEASVKMKTADAILDSLITEAVQIMCDIGKKRRTRINDARSY